MKSKVDNEIDELVHFGIPPAQAKVLKNHGINSIKALIHLFPKGYVDFRETKGADELIDRAYCAVIGTAYSIKNSKNFMQVKLRDEKTGRSINLHWFNTAVKAYPGVTYIAGGPVQSKKPYPPAIINPIVFSEDISSARITPIYPDMPGININRWMKQILDCVAIREFAPYGLTNKFGVVSEHEAYIKLHLPECAEDVKAARKRIIFDDIYRFALGMSRKHLESTYNTRFLVTRTEKTREIIKNLPFALTEDQSKTLGEITANLKQKRVNVIIQGDVGCGKSIVAFILMSIMAENGYQSVIIAPTAILAKQHYSDLQKLFGDKFNIEYLGGESKASEKKRVTNGLADGNIQMLVGTHAAFSEGVTYKNLGMYIVDEEHRFGVEQKEKLSELSRSGIHSIYMSATLIPRTKGLSMYGKTMDIYSIMTMPAGRKPVRTELTYSGKQTKEIMLKSIREGHQCFVVCPLIEDNRKIDAESVQEAYKSLVDDFSDTDVSIGMIHGKMKKEEVQGIKDRFQSGEIDVLISTTIVEVGINVPNATVMVIKGADRFGLFQLHQLRGRVGRGTAAGVCILESSPNAADKAVMRMTEFAKTHSGFDITDLELKMKGSGDFFGTKQSGENRQLMFALKYPKWYEYMLNYMQGMPLEKITQLEKLYDDKGV